MDSNKNKKHEEYQECELYNENFTFPIFWSVVNDTEQKNFFSSLDKNIRYRIYNCVSIDDNIILSLTSKSMYLDIRLWFKMYFPVGLPNYAPTLPHNECYNCGSKSIKHLFKVKLNDEKPMPLNLREHNLLYLCRSRNEKDNITEPYIQRQKKITQNGKHTHEYSFALIPEEHQPSGHVNWSRIDNFHLTFDFLSIYKCWKCFHITQMKLLNKECGSNTW